MSFKNTTAALLISTCLFCNGLSKQPNKNTGDVMVDRIVVNMQGGKMANRNIRSSTPQKIYLSTKERIKWLGSAKVTASLKDFEEFKKLLPKIAENIGRALRECKDASCIKELIPKIGFISNNTPAKPRHDFGLIEPVNDRDLYYEMLRDSSVSSDKKLGILALMLFSFSISEKVHSYGSLESMLLMLSGDREDVDDIIKKRKNERKKMVEEEIEILTEDDQRLKKPVKYVFDCILNNSAIDDDPITALMLLRDKFNSSFADKK